MKLKIELEPVPQSRPRFTRGRCYEPARMRAYKRAIADAARAAMDGAAPTTAAVSVAIRFWRKFAATSRRYGDLDNLMKAVLDGLNGVAFADDSQVISATLEKLQSPEPRLEIEIKELTPSTTTPLEIATQGAPQNGAFD